MEQLLCVNITTSAALIAEVVPYLHSQEKVSLFLAQIISDEAAEKEWRDKLVLDLFARFLRERHTVEPKAARHIWHRYDCAFDVIGDEATVGKTLCSDADNQKTTFMSYFDVEGAKKYASELTLSAIEDIKQIENSDALAELALYLLERNN